MADFWEKRNEEGVRDYELHLISFRRKGTDGYSYSCLCLGQKQTPEAWHIEILKKLISDFESGLFAGHPAEADDFSDLV